MAENLGASSGIQSAWDRAFAQQNQQMGRTPPPAAEDPAVTAARISDLEGRVTSLESKPPAAGE
jgi:hypothetical protein